LCAASGGITSAFQPATQPIDSYDGKGHETDIFCGHKADGGRHDRVEGWTTTTSVPRTAPWSPALYFAALEESEQRMALELDAAYQSHVLLHGPLMVAVTACHARETLALACFDLHRTASDAWMLELQETVEAAWRHRDGAAAGPKPKRSHRLHC
jgi:hypothetical protein